MFSSECYKTPNQRFSRRASGLGVRVGKPPADLDLDEGLAGGRGAGRKGHGIVSTLRVVLAPGELGHAALLLACFFLLGRFCIKQKEFLPQPQFLF